ncbi:hypothetical protein ARMSODRAFT_1028334 [Armillaria solidipes]|uniref:Uncharacterized protein n=1 Tax=Armillaria solidipes TaxID=1076256 RepID=A0A2H3ATU2_9AGAR|nr:hypothetical protein ARMSODRAFT_1028334 [Armillaria solidipes]
MLYANSAEIGSGMAYEGSSSTSKVHTTGLNPEIDNVIAINATNTGGPAGLIATIHVDYLDGTSKILDNLAWIAANVQSNAGMAPWGAIFLPPALDLMQSNWIWTNYLPTQQ